MKKIISFLCVAALAVSLFALAGCGGSKEIPADSVYIGKWEAVRAEMLGQSTTLEEALEGGKWIFTLNADGTAVEESAEETVNGVWSITKDGIKVKLDGASKAIKFTAQGDELVTKLVASIYFAKQS